MSTELPRTGTIGLLEAVSPYIPDDFIIERCPRGRTGGRRYDLDAAQLWRVHLLAVLTSSHSLNLVLTQLREQPAWRRFCRLRRVLPGARMLHEFRQQIEVSGLRRINQHLVSRLISRRGIQPNAVALMDATDLEAASNGFKKNKPALTPLHVPRWDGERSRPDRADGLWDIQSIRCVYGCRRGTTRSPWCL
jgi:hypothetical protein